MTPKSPLPAIRALVIDMDGTLTDSDPIHEEAFSRALTPFGIAMTPERHRDEISGCTKAEIGRRPFPDRTPEEHERFADAKERLFRNLAATLQPLPGLPALLADVEAREWPTALVTNAPRANADHMLRALGLTGRFNAVVLGEEVARPKPDPMPYRLAVRRLGLVAGEAAAFEDSVAGVRSAHSAGLQTFGVATSQTPETLLRAGANHVIDDFESPLLRRILGFDREAWDLPLVRASKEAQP